MTVKMRGIEDGLVVDFEKRKKRKKRKINRLLFLPFLFSNMYIFRLLLLLLLFKYVNQGGAIAGARTLELPWIFFDSLPNIFAFNMISV